MWLPWHAIAEYDLKLPFAFEGCHTLLGGSERPKAISPVAFPNLAQFLTITLGYTKIKGGAREPAPADTSRTQGSSYFGLNGRCINSLRTT